MPLDEKSVVPLYYQLKEELQEQIKGGAWPVGQELPTERELSETYQVSRATVRQALNELEMEGLVVRKQGRGTFVARPKLAIEPSMVPQMRAQGLTPGVRILSATLETGIPARIREALGVSPGDPVHVVMRVRLADGEPVALETIFVSDAMAPGLTSEGTERLNVLQYVADHRGIYPTRYAFSMEPVLISEFEAAQLATSVGKPALLMERVMYADDQPILLLKRVSRGDRCRFVATNDSKGSSLQLHFTVPKRD